MNELAIVQRPRPWYLLIFAILLIAGGLALHFYRLRQADTSPPPESTPWALDTGEVQRGSVAASVQSVAVVEAPHIISLSPQIQGTVVGLGPRAGVSVKRGERLVRIDARIIASNLDALEQQRRAAASDANYAFTQQTRVDAVLAEGGVSQSQADQTRAASDAARARAQALADQISALRVQLGYADILAPQDAVVAQRLVQLGDTVLPGKPVYQLTAGRGAVVRVGLPADQIAKVRVGDALELRQGDATLSLTIARVAPAVNEAGLGTVEADMGAPPFGLPSGSTVAATLRTAATGAALTVPVTALVGHGPRAYVMAFAPGAKPGEPGHLKRVPVRVLQEDSRRAAVEAALQPGMRVVIGQTAVLARLRHGDAAVTSSKVSDGQ